MRQKIYLVCTMDLLYKSSCLSVQRLQLSLLMLCCRYAGPPQSPNMSGVLLQQAVAKSERKKWIGTSGYKMIKKMAWGDLWPSSFQKYAHSVKERAEHLS